MGIDNSEGNVIKELGKYWMSGRKEIESSKLPDFLVLCSRNLKRINKVGFECSIFVSRHV